MAESVRAFWKGSLRLSLVIIPVRLVSATKSESRVQMHQVDRKSKQRIRYQKVTPDGKVVDKDDIVSGYQTESGYVLFEGEELDAVKLKSRHTIELTQFVDHCEIDALYFERPYFILPDGDTAEEGYCVIRDALRKARKMAIGQLTMRGREHLVALEALGDGLALQTLRYDEEFRDDEDLFSEYSDVDVRKDLVEMATDLIEKRSSAFDPAVFKNNYASAFRKLVQEKVSKGKVVDVGGDEVEAPRNVIDFMEALKKSVAQADKPSGKSEDAAKSSSRRAPKTSGRQERRRARNRLKRSRRAPARA
jgi:DNA end-binding protein Ku